MVKNALTELQESELFNTNGGSGINIGMIETFISGVNEVTQNFTFISYDLTL